MNIPRWGSRATTLALLGVFLSVPVFAGTTGKIAGKVTDARTGEPLPVANVVIVSRWENGRESRVQNILGAASDANGEYFILNVPPGEYSVEAHLVGFADELVRHVIVNIDRTVRVDLRMSSADVDVDEVVVIANRERIRQDVAYSAKGISVEDLKMAPQARLTDLLTNEVGVEQDAYGVTVRGSTEKEVAYNIDGVSMSDSRTNRPYTNVNTELVQEVQLITGRIQRGVLQCPFGDGKRGDEAVARPLHRIGEGALSHLPHQKHFGPNMWTTENWWDFGRFQFMKSIEGPAYVNELGKTVKSWTNERGENIDRDKDGIPDFQGWDAYAATALNQYKLIPADCFKLWKYQHRNEQFARSSVSIRCCNMAINPITTLKLSLGGPVWPFGDNASSLGSRFSGGIFAPLQRVRFSAFARRRHRRERRSFRLNYQPSGSTKMSLFGLLGNTKASGWFLGEDHAYVSNPGYIIQNVYGDLGPPGIRECVCRRQ